MELLLKTTDPNQIIDLIQGILEEEFFSLIGMYECNVPEMDYWIKSEIIKRLSDNSVHLTTDRYSMSGGNLINDSIIIFNRPIDDSYVEFEYIAVENEPYIDQDSEILHSDYKECWLNYDKAFENFKEWAYEYINKG